MFLAWLGQSLSHAESCKKWKVCLEMKKTMPNGLYESQLLKISREALAPCCEILPMELLVQRALLRLWVF